MLTSEDVLTWHFQTLAAYFGQTSRSADLADDTAPSFFQDFDEGGGGAKVC